MAALSSRLRCVRQTGIGRALRRLLSLAVVICATIVAATAGHVASATSQAPSASVGGPPQRIVSFVPAVTEMLFAMDAGARVVGVSAYDRFPPAAARLPRVGGLLDPNVERLLSLRPDLVIVYSTQRDLRAQLDRARIPQFAYVHRDLADVTQTVRAVGQRAGSAVGAERLASDIEQRLNTIRRQVASQRRPRTLLVFGREPGALRRILASGGYGFLHDLLQLAGGDDVMADVQRESVEMSAETVLGRAPDVIIEVKYGSARSMDVAAIRGEWNPLAAVPAIRNGRVYVLQGDEFVIPGPRLVDAAQALARVLHPTLLE